MNLVTTDTTLNVVLCKTLRILNLITVLFLVTCLHVSAHSVGQTVTISTTNSPVQKVFKKISRQTGVSIVYDESLLRNLPPVTIHVKDASIAEVLNLCLKGRQFEYSSDERIIIIKREVNPSPIPIPVRESSPPLEIRGTVTDENGKPLQGVNIVLKGSQSGTTTDAQGVFVLNLSGNGILVFSYVDYITQEVVVGSLTTINVRLVLSQESMQKVVVIGYGSQTKKGVSGAVSVVTEKNFNKGVNQTAADLLQGKVPGLVITTQSGDVTEMQTMRLRGVSSLTGSSSPFVVIDGVPGMDMTSVAPDDIESISVLKDGAASAIYGSRSASGVIIITTKKGKYGQANVQYSGYVAFDKAAKKPPVLGAQEWRDYTNSQGMDVTGLDKGANTDWFEEITRTAISQNHSLSVTGGSEKSNYRASLNYLDRQGILKDNYVKRYNGLVSLNQKAINDKVNIGITVGVVQSDYNPSDPTNIQLARNMLPVYPVRNPDGSWFQIQDFAMGNPLHNIEENKNEYKTALLYGNLKTTIELYKGLTAGVNLFKQRQSSDQSLYNSITSPAGFRTKGFARRGNWTADKRIMELTLQYAKELGEHKFTVLGGYSYEDNFYQAQSAQNRSFITDLFGADNLSTGENLLPTDVFSVKNMSKLISGFGRMNYSFGNKYVVALTLRRDGSSKFGDNHKWGTFPSASVAWNISEEPFLGNSKSISDLKLRVGYGVVGNQDGIDPYNSLALYGRGDEFFDNGIWRNSYLYSQNVNPNLKWEQTASLNIGVDYGLFNNRISGSIDYYIKKTSDMLYTYNVPVPPNLYPTMLANVGDITNEGIEVLINAEVMNTSKFRWSTSLNFAKNDNVVTRLSNDLYTTSSIRTGPINLRGQGNVTSHIIEEGKPVGTFYGFKSSGLDEQGNFIFEDLDKDGSITSGDFTYIGNAIPKFTYGILNTLNFSNWDFTIFFRGVVGNDILDGSRMQDANKTWLPGSNVFREALTNGINVAPRYSSFYIENGSFLRLDNTALGYTILPKNNIGIKKCRIYLAAQNLFVISKFKGNDPEVNMNGLAPGVIELGFVPRARTFTAGVSVNF